MEIKEEMPERTNNNTLNWTESNIKDDDDGVKRLGKMKAIL